MDLTDHHLDLVFRKRTKSYEPPVPLIPIADTHAHLMSFRGKDPAWVIARAALAGVGQMTTIWDPVADACTWFEYHERLGGWIEEARGLLESRAASGAPESDDSHGPLSLLDGIGYLSGVHPYGAYDYNDEVHAQVVGALDDPLCSGVGEIGLDYHLDADYDYESAPHELQIEVMERQLAVAIERDLPVELHIRNDNGDDRRLAHRDALRSLERIGVPAAGCVLHCFGEDRATMERFVEMGCLIAFGGAATFKRNDGVREAFAACPLDQLIFETDCPYMAPEPLRGVECEPAMITWTVDALLRDRAERTGEDPIDIARAAWCTSTRLFGGGVR
ncbi:MAG: TatD family hydrolase [Collinsella sp.]|nr:TatD family hydrolase [Collinsella sp.]